LTQTLAKLLLWGTEVNAEGVVLREGVVHMNIDIRKNVAGSLSTGEERGSFG